MAVMARARNKLNTKEVAALAQPGRFSDGGGLYLLIDGAGDGQRRRWLFIFTVAGKRREMGLGPYPAVSLADARKARDAAERLVRDGKDPIEQRDEARRLARAKPTFGEIADALFEAKKSEWRNAKHADQWRQALTILAEPLRGKPVDEIDTAAILDVLKPFWSAKPETAARLRQRIEAVLDAARAQGHRAGESPAAWRGHLAHLLPKRQTLAKGHHAAMAYADVPAFMEKLRAHQARSVAAHALELLILTAARSGEVYGARWSEIDLEAQVWTVPPERMKAGREHRVPLCGRAVAILAEMAKVRTTDFVFPGRSAGRLSHIQMAKVMTRIGVENATPHGFRSAFRDWAGNETSFPREVAEAALAHSVGDEVERAYRRSDALEKRRALMQAWARHCEPSNADNVIALPSRQGARA
jgi:integrase